MGSITIVSTRVMATSAEKVWQVLGPDFVNISHWADGVASSVEDTSLGDPLPGAPVAGRICQVDGLGEARELILHYSVEQQQITYNLKASGLPGFVTGLQNAWSVKSVSDQRAEVTSTISVTTAGILGMIMTPLMKRNFTKAIAGALEGLEKHATA